MKEQKLAFVFFNCDEEKSNTSMNIFFNKEIYRDLKGARKALLAKVEEELAAGRVHVAEENKAKVAAAILEGSPTDASAYIQYGAIEAIPII